MTDVKIEISPLFQLEKIQGFKKEVDFAIDDKSFEEEDESQDEKFKKPLDNPEPEIAEYNKKGFELIEKIL